MVDARERLSPRIEHRTPADIPPSPPRWRPTVRLLGVALGLMMLAGMGCQTDVGRATFCHSLLVDGQPPCCSWCRTIDLHREDGRVLPLWTIRGQQLLQPRGARSSRQPARKALQLSPGPRSHLSPGGPPQQRRRRSVGCEELRERRLLQAGESSGHRRHAGPAGGGGPRGRRGRSPDSRRSGRYVTALSPTLALRLSHVARGSRRSPGRGSIGAPCCHAASASLAGRAALAAAMWRSSSA